MKKFLGMMMSLTMSIGFLAGCAASEEAISPTVTDAQVAESVVSGGEDGSLQKIKEAGVLKVGCKTDVPCFGLQNTGTGKYEGLEIDLAYEIAADIFAVTPEEAKAQDLVTFQGVTAKTRGPLLDSGEIDLVIATFTITEERKTQWNFSTPYIEDALGLMCLNASGYSSMADVDGAIIGVAQGATTKTAIENYIKDQNLPIQVTFEEFDGYPALSVALSSGNIDIFSVDRAILAGYKDDTNMILPERFGMQQYGVASKLTNLELAKEVNQVVEGLIESGKMQEMITSWGIE